MTVTLNFSDDDYVLLLKYAEKAHVSVEDFIIEAAMKEAIKRDRADKQI
ncbi:MAG: hypothetical protein IJ862_00520 [Selenomonadaceae bacterium]|nr:hypothetical protein [Selenomonadaceae bacterium]